MAPLYAPWRTPCAPRHRRNAQRGLRCQSRIPAMVAANPKAVWRVACHGVPSPSLCRWAGSSCSVLLVWPGQVIRRNNFYSDKEASRTMGPGSDSFESRPVPAGRLLPVPGALLTAAPPGHSVRYMDKCSHCERSGKASVNGERDHQHRGIAFEPRCPEACDCLHADDNALAYRWVRPAAR